MLLEPRKKENESCLRKVVFKDVGAQRPDLIE